MAIVGTNTILNQYTPTFFIKNLKDGQSLIYDSVRRAFVNSDSNGAGSVDRLSDLLDVSEHVGNPLALKSGQVLMYNSTSEQWENTDISEFLKPSDVGIKDLIEEQETLTIQKRHQYIVTSRLEVAGRIENYGRISVL